ncbi:hypothetical protein NXS19_004838 [Fusarium pseudograminearum]|nr:hypothetical protein NXS19_004838 [Fusarium pseudograminearum]
MEYHAKQNRSRCLRLVGCGRAIDQAVQRRHTTCRPLDSPRIGFVFSGQGAQYPRMGQSLLRTWPTFTSIMKRAAECVKACGSSWDLLEELFKDASESRMEDSCIAQHMSTAVQICLVDTLKDLGVIPTAVVGHSSGD